MFMWRLYRSYSTWLEVVISCDGCSSIRVSRVWPQQKICKSILSCCPEHLINVLLETTVLSLRCIGGCKSQSPSHTCWWTTVQRYIITWALRSWPHRLLALCLGPRCWVDMCGYWIHSPSLRSPPPPASPASFHVTFPSTTLAIAMPHRVSSHQMRLSSAFWPIARIWTRPDTR